MLKYLIQVLQNLLTTAVLTSVLAVPGYRDSRYRRCFAIGCVSAAAAALVLAVLRRTTVFINREYVNIFILSISLITGILFILFSLIKRRSQGEGPRAVLGAVLAGSLLFYALPTIFLYPPEFVMAGQSIWSTDFLFKLIGFLAGLLVTGLSALALFICGKKLLSAGEASAFDSAPKSGRTMIQLVLSTALGINMIPQFTSIIQFLLARRIIRLSRRSFKILIFLINNNHLFLYAILALTLLLVLPAFKTTLGVRGPFANPAEKRKDKAGRRRLRRWCALTAAGYLFSVFSLTVLKVYNEREVVLSPAEPMTVENGEIIIPLEQIEDWRLHRFAHITAEGVELRFIVIRKSDAAYGVGLDACDICGATGYYERKNQVICRLCDVVMNISTIGFKGGCNPVPLASAIRGGRMVIQLEDLEKEQDRFK